MASFKRHMKNTFQTKMNPIYKNGIGSAFVNHSRIRMGLSALRNQLHSHGIIENNICLCNTNQPETPHHYILHCPRFAAQRTILFHELRRVYPQLMNQAPLSSQQEKKLLSNLIHGDTELENDSNTILLAVTLIFIENSKRFLWFITNLNCKLPSISHT